MGGGDPRSTPEGSSSYPDEFKPLASDAVKQIQAMQQALPLVSHAGFQPAGVAGLSPMDQFTINELVSRTPYLPASFESLMQLPEPVGAASQGAVKAGKGSKGAAGALDYLSGFLGRDVRPEPATTEPYQVLTRLPMPETAFPGLTRAALEESRAKMSLLGPGGTPTPTSPFPAFAPAPALPPAAPAAPSITPADVAQIVLRASVPPVTQGYFDQLVAQGVPPDQAAAMATYEAASQANSARQNEGGGGE